MGSGNYRDVRARVTAGAKREYVEETKGVLRVFVREKAKAGAANGRARALVAAFFGLPNARVRIVGGASRPGKMFRIWN